MKVSADRQAQYEHHLKRMGVPVIVGLGPSNRHPPPSQRLVHFDLKGAPPKISYFKRLMPILKTLGATGILLEYEDMFPFEGTISPISAKNAYSKKNLVDLLQTAHALGLNVIPLVQTFGHLEFALKLKEFQSLREVEQTPQSICPSLNTSFTFIMEMLSQVVELHSFSQINQNSVMGHNDHNDFKTIPKLTHVHIGADEVFQLGECSRCRETAKIRDQIFLDHVYAVASQAKKRWPHLNLIIWDDMLRHIPLELLLHSGLSKLVEPMIWVYAEDIYKFMQSQTWDKYSQVFSSAWVAGSFKGAFGETLMVPVGRRHLENTLKWLAIIQGEGSR